MSDDLISRQAAIDAIEFGITYAKAINKETGEVKELFQASNDELRKAEDRIKQLPPAQRTGRWIIKENPGTEWYRVTCSACGEDVSSVIPTIGFFPNVKALWDFCPNCGCAMKGEEE